MSVVSASLEGGALDWFYPLEPGSIPGYLSSVLQIKVIPTNWISDCKWSKVEDLDKADIFLVENLSMFREELANQSGFARKLSSVVDIFVNDNFSQSHKILASTVGVARYCYASIAGFSFEEELTRMVEMTRTSKQPYIVIIGGNNLKDKASAIHFLASKCDGLVFVGMMAFQIMHAKGIPVPLSFVDPGLVEDSLKIIKYARKRNIPLLLPKDFWCVKNSFPNQQHSFPAHGVLDGWSPVDLGPTSLNEISSLLSKCEVRPGIGYQNARQRQKVLWIGPLKLALPRADCCRAFKLALMLENLGQSGCDVIVIGNAACREMTRPSVCTLYENASVVWEYLKGRVLPGCAALDRAYPFETEWDTIYDDPTQPLVVDIGSGNGLFLLEMSRRQKELNFLGLDSNKKLVGRCLDTVNQSGPKNRCMCLPTCVEVFCGCEQNPSQNGIEKDQYNHHFVLAELDEQDLYRSGQQDVFVAKEVKSVGASAATIASVGVAAGVGIVLSSSIHSIRSWLGIHRWLNNHLVMPFWICKSDVHEYFKNICLHRLKYHSPQCPNPDFNKPENRWRMLQRALVEAIVDLLKINGKVFLQSDVETVACTMREDFIMYGKNKLAIVNNEDGFKVDHDGWLRDNPYGVRSDWEQHVIDRGAPMYRVMFSKVVQR
ncbi:hypothetical protein IFM89_007482 [Coptis chinensis]|uniref:Phosphoglycerate kinase n=1 Tax=Coptis chinensis TaxID=261450 RepID=A0A835HCX6_9MAGN|nr:hypothetical protein IFM89_007482 [Coptis chinensis]